MDPDQERLAAAWAAVAALGAALADLQRDPRPRRPAFDAYLPEVIAAGPGARRTYGTYWRRMAEGNRYAADRQTAFLASKARIAELEDGVIAGTSRTAERLNGHDRAAARLTGTCESIGSFHDRSPLVVSSTPHLSVRECEAARYYHQYADRTYEARRSIATRRVDGHARPMRFIAWLPSHDALTAELRQLRRTGLVRLRGSTFTALTQAAMLAGLAKEEGGANPAAVESLLRSAIQRLGGGRLGDAAEYTFGLVHGTRDWPAQDRRRQAAETYRVSVDRFRKHYEEIVCAQTAEAILSLLHDRVDVPREAPSTKREGRLVAATVDARSRHDSIPVVVHCCSVDTITGVDIVVSPTNTFFELASVYKVSIAACLRSAGALKSAVGEIVVDAVARDLDVWRRANMRVGLPVAPGTVAPTPVEPGSGLGFRWIYHAAVATPRAGTNDYFVEPSAIARAVRNVFAAARAGGSEAAPRSICFPLLGAGRGGLDAWTSASNLWRAVRAELTGGSQPSALAVHMVVLTEADAEVVRQVLAEPPQ
ncbi:macro domain-containing protein [Dactylosporangium sp. CA-139066]|uniref:macro domain-containing protein n=1 Tax=Dactylosporangium sp. CA-139066 TaxID=3239930 RepID=UPI003D928183